MRGLSGAAVAVLLFSAVPMPARAASAGVSSAGYCPDGNGVTVVVDFRELGGGTLIRCAPGDQASGLAALKNAGVRITGTSRWSEAFICRIEGKPPASQEPCIDTPPASAYWSYWHARDGGSWTYSQQGVAARKPPLGSFDGWSFALDKMSSTVPPPGVTPRRPPPPSPPPAVSPSQTRPSPTTPRGATAAATAIATANATATATAAEAQAPSVAVSGFTPRPSIVDALPMDSSGVPLSTVAGFAAVVVLLGAAGFAAVRRRKRSEGHGADG